MNLLACRAIQPQGVQVGPLPGEDDELSTEVTRVGKSREGARTVPVAPRHCPVVVAPEVAARIVARRAAGDLPVDIGHDLHLTPLEVRDVLRAADGRVSR